MKFQNLLPAPPCATRLSLALTSGILVVAAIAQAPGAASGATDRSATLARFQPLPAPPAAGLVLRPGDRLAICGDSITEQRMYSRLVETYLTVCQPQLDIRVRQYGWSGERAPGFLARMTNDVLRFRPTIATTCYGMNDHEYRAYEPRIGDTYRQASIAIIRAFKAAGARVIQGSPGCVGQRPPWTTATNATIEDLNLNLCELRNLGIGIAQAESVGFADVFWPMLNAGLDGRERYGPHFAIAGKDGVHPDWAGQLVMAYAFLKAFGLDGDLGTFTVDLDRNEASATGGHQVLGWNDGVLSLRSARYPFCAPGGELGKDNCLRSALALVPFHQELNRLRLVVRGARSDNLKVSWGGTDARSFTRAELEAGINLAEAFPVNPFCEAFARVDHAVAAKQQYETRQIKDLFHGPEGATDLELTATLTEKVRTPLAEAIRAAFQPVQHSLRVAME